MTDNFKKDIDIYLQYTLGTTMEKADVKQLYTAISSAAMKSLAPVWQAKNKDAKRACYFSAEFLVGRLIYSNLFNLGLLEECAQLLKQHGLDINMFEQVADDALGNGGLGRLAACFLDSAATHSIPLNGYGIRYRYGLFKQYIEDGFQKEIPDDWLNFGDPWSVRKDDQSVLVQFNEQTVRAVPYDMPVIGYGGKCVNTLRLWQAEPVQEFDFTLFNDQKYTEAVQEKNDAFQICAVLYPNDDTKIGKQLRLKQQYFFSSASLQSIVREYTQKHGQDFSQFASEYAIQLNDTHPVVSIPELLRILMEQHYMPFEKAFEVVQATFAYTNHTVMVEALEKWSVDLFVSVLPHVYAYVVQINNHLRNHLHSLGIDGKDIAPYEIITNGTIHMAWLAVFATHSTNGVAQLHSDILRDSLLAHWHKLYPDRLNNKTNGITQRRWLALCNPQLADFVTQRIGDGWITDLNQMDKLKPFADNANDLDQFMQIKRLKKQQLCEYISLHEGVDLNPDCIFDIQVKRLHEYKRQLLNAFSILDLYYGIKDGSIKNYHPTVFLFGAKAAPGYYRAKGIIKYIGEIACLVNNDPQTRGIITVVFVQNYNVSYAEKLIPAADISQQISLAGTEASGTGNMKFMLNGAVTLGTLDGANVEIVEQVGQENSYIFGATVQQVEKVSDTYNPTEICRQSPRINRIVQSLVDGTFDDGKTGMFAELYSSIIEGASWHKPDQYYLLLDLIPYCDTRLRANADYKNKQEFAKKCLLNVASAGKFSSDRTIKQYASEIWQV